MIDLTVDIHDPHYHIFPQILIKKELEGEIMLLQDDMDEAEATVNQLNNEIPRQQDILEQVRLYSVH